MKPHIEIILPVYNEAESLPPLLTALDLAREALKGEATVSYLFVNDGSSDTTETILTESFQTRQDIRIVKLIHNFGHNSALACGLDHFEGDIAVIMDADLQDLPEALPNMFARWKEGAETVVAARGKRAEKGKIFFKAFYFLLHRTATHLPPVSFGTYCLMDKRVVSRLKNLKERNRYFPGLVTYSSASISPIASERHARISGRSRVGIFGLLHLAVTALISFSTTPVRLVSFLGLLTSACAISGGLIIVSIKLFTDKAIPGWASILTAIFFASGVQLLCVGIIGEYIARIYEEVKARPLYWVERVWEKKQTTTNSQQEATSEAA